jgi:hypothetical protein
VQKGQEHIISHFGHFDGERAADSIFLAFTHEKAIASFEALEWLFAA